MRLKLDRVQTLRGKAEQEIDRHFGGKIDHVIGPLGALHALKRSSALSGNGGLVESDDDRQAILSRAAEQDKELARLDRERRAAKQKVRAAGSVAEIKAVLASLN
ncbi:hypothetical protein [Chelativorans sp. YIM 93263]|uniref:hypothetical protein n=1 Tax=Chelativorans sp. YIM 93263 TaxID=2906648 RepID=UPI002379A54A|nr:hypothetical protein [Chelativorans sp. YIM 93263]